MSGVEDRIPPKAMEAAVQRSGYLLEARVEQVLRERGFYVHANDRYSDPVTGKTREVDIKAYRDDIPFKGILQSHFESTIVVECLKSPQPLGFLLKNPQTPALNQYQIRTGGFPLFVQTAPPIRMWQRIIEFLDPSAYHHYCRGPVATQYFSFERKGNSAGSRTSTGSCTTSSDEWKAQKPNDVHNLCTDLLTAVESIREYETRELVGLATRVDHLHPAFLVYWPLVVVEGDLVEVKEREDGIEVRPIDHVQFCTSKFYKDKKVNYQVDVVAEPYLPSYIEIFDADSREMLTRLRQHDEHIVRCAQFISESLKQRPDQVAGLLGIEP